MEKELLNTGNAKTATSNLSKDEKKAFKRNQIMG